MKAVLRAKQRQNRPKSRAAHGSPKYSMQLACWCSKSMHAKVMRRGGSAFIRAALAAALKGEVVRG